MQHSLRHFGSQLSQQWFSMDSVRPELCGDYSLEPTIALCGGTV